VTATVGQRVAVDAWRSRPVTAGLTYLRDRLLRTARRAGRYRVLADGERGARLDHQRAEWATADTQTWHQAYRLVARDLGDIAPPGVDDLLEVAMTDARHALGDVDALA
jgi:hypothetical protein